MDTSPLTVAVTGPTGTFGAGLLPLLEREARVERVVGIARRPLDPSQHPWTKLDYRQGDVRNQDALERAFAGADVVVHLAFMITGTTDRATTRSINVDGTLNTFRAAAAAGVKRFVYASSVAAYGFHPDNPVPMDEEWPVRPAARLFYAQEKAELEGLLQEEAAAHPEIELYLLRPPIVLGPNAAGAKLPADGLLAGIRRLLADGAARLPALPLPVPALPLQVIHEDDVGSALLLCVLGAGAPGAYNIAADETVTAADVARHLGVRPLPIPERLVTGAGRALSAIPVPAFVPPAVEWVEVLSHPAVMDTGKAKRELGWSPRHSARETLSETFGDPV
ncbi:MAG: NAD-dependent epimerase/dehydratase [Solirubrobacterales bacterium]|nr:NAD-dependent epimerase/dehydratase [Solirubrobacterales bacterium]